MPMANASIDNKNDKRMEYCQLNKRENHCLIWTLSFSKELVHLAQGKGGKSEFANTILFILVDNIPSDIRRDVTYEIIVVNL